MQRIEDVKLEVDYVTALIKIRAVILDFLYPEEKTEVPVMLHYLQNATFHSKVDKLTSELMESLESCNLKN